jgi:hypothetical protein
MRLLWLALLGASLLNANAEFTIRLETGDEPLENAIVSAPGVDADIPAVGILRNSKGEELAFQKTPIGEVVFIVPALRPHSANTYVMTESKPGGEGISANLENGKITVVDHGKKVFTYQGKETPLPRSNIKPTFKRGGYIHPLYTPGGVLATDDYAPNHLHHHGIWFPWTKTEFEGRKPDFWNMGEGTGKVEFARFGERWSGPVHAGFQAEHRFVDLSANPPKAALAETWTVTAYHVPAENLFLFDLVSTQRCASASPLILPKYYYGGLGFRGNWAWNGAKNTEFLTSNGETDRVKGNETRANWCSIGGQVNGQFAGVTIFCHPDNFRAPQPMRLHPTEPFFCYAPSQEGDWKIEPGKPYVSRYRFAVSDGRPDKSKLDQIWNAYAHPPKVTIEKR